MIVELMKNVGESVVTGDAIADVIEVVSDKDQMNMVKNVAIVAGVVIVAAAATYGIATLSFKIYDKIAKKEVKEGA